ncbi:MAG: hypothetical protein ICV83_17580 [Cytophagales bacterium]|nr:hypothetical protein [Cytophagales bacterium]
MNYYLQMMQAVRTLLDRLRMTPQAIPSPHSLPTRVSPPPPPFRSSRLRFPFVPVSLPPVSRLPFFLLGLALAPAAFGQHTSSQSADLKGLKSLAATIRISAGTLKLTAQDAPAAESRFTYTRDAWKPRVTFSREGGQGRLTIEQPESQNVNMKDKDRNDWEIRLSRGVPTDLTLRMGAGDGTVDLRGAKVRRLEMEAGAGSFKVNLANTSVASLKVNAGVGELILDLTGERTTNLQATINGGIGGIKVTLPRKTGVRVKVNGLGSFDSAGFRKQGDYYVNDAYGKTPHSLDLSVSGGLGDLELSLQ